MGYMGKKMELESQNLTEITLEKQRLQKNYDIQMNEFNLQRKKHKISHPEELNEV